MRFASEPPSRRVHVQGGKENSTVIAWMKEEGPKCGVSWLRPSNVSYTPKTTQVFGAWQRLLAVLPSAAYASTNTCPSTATYFVSTWQFFEWNRIIAASTKSVLKYAIQDLLCVDSLLNVPDTESRHTSRRLTAFISTLLRDWQWVQCRLVRAIIHFSQSWPRETSAFISDSPPKLILLCESLSQLHITESMDRIHVLILTTNHLCVCSHFVIEVSIEHSADCGTCADLQMHHPVFAPSKPGPGAWRGFNCSNDLSPWKLLTIGKPILDHFSFFSRNKESKETLNRLQWIHSIAPPTNIWRRAGPFSSAVKPQKWVLLSISSLFVLRGHYVGRTDRVRLGQFKVSRLRFAPEKLWWHLDGE